MTEPACLTLFSLRKFNDGVDQTTVEVFFSRSHMKVDHSPEVGANILQTKLKPTTTPPKFNMEPQNDGLQ